MDWTMPPATGPAAEPTPTGPKPPDERWRRFGGKAALVGAGLVAGGVLATAVTANAASGSSSAPSAPSASSENGSTPDCGPGGRGGPGAALSQTGTVTAVGASTVSIRDSAGKVTTYTVTSSSDIDKNGEAKLSDLKAGDVVRFSTTNGTTIAKLHTGNEDLNRPSGGHRGDGAPMSGYGPGPGMGYGSGEGG